MEVVREIFSLLKQGSGGKGLLASNRLVDFVQPDYHLRRGVIVRPGITHQIISRRRPRTYPVLGLDQVVANFDRHIPVFLLSGECVQD